ncbi:MAG: deoxynucleoside kinase, partial [Bacteroidota bacterium]|nr:deoxynucleoside kinase [Bacteroidota bacterium]
GRNYEQSIPDEYLIKIQNTYFDFIKQLNDLRILVIDVNNIDFANDNAHYNHMMEIINKPYNAGITRITA